MLTVAYLLFFLLSVLLAVKRGSRCQLARCRFPQTLRNNCSGLQRKSCSFKVKIKRLLPALTVLISWLFFDANTGLAQVSAVANVEFVHAARSYREGGHERNLINVTHSIAIEKTGFERASVEVSVVGGTASTGEDYRFVPTTLSWDGGETGIKFVTLETIAERIDEDDETVILQLFEPPSSGIPVTFNGNASHVATILNDDQPPIIEFTRAQFTADERDGANDRLFVNLVRHDNSIVGANGLYGGPVTATVTFGGGTATAGSDFSTPTSLQVHWTGTEIGAKSLIFPIIDDINAEGDETIEFKVAISPNGAGVANGEIGLQADAVGVIYDDDPKLDISALDGTAFETIADGASFDSGCFIVSNPSSSRYSATDVRFNIDGDPFYFGGRTGCPGITRECGFQSSISLAPGSRCFVRLSFGSDPVNAISASAGDYGSTLKVDYLNPLPKARITATSIDVKGKVLPPADPVFTFEITPASQTRAEGDQAFVTLRRTDAETASIKVRLETTDADASMDPDNLAKADVDYDSQQSVMTLAAGDEMSIAVSTIDDTDAEQDEYFVVQAVEDGSGDSPLAQATVIIARSDIESLSVARVDGGGGTFEIVADNADVDFGCYGITAMYPGEEVELVRLVAGLTAPFSTDNSGPKCGAYGSMCATNGASLGEGDTCIAQVNFGPSTDAGLKVSTQLRARGEVFDGSSSSSSYSTLVESAPLTLSGAVSANAVVGALAFVDINSAGLFDPSGAERDLKELAITVSRTLQPNQTAQAISVPIVLTGTGDFAALEGEDFTSSDANLTWAAGDTADKTFKIKILDDAITEPDETFLISLGAASNSNSPKRSGLKPPGKTPLLGAASANAINVTILNDDVQLLVSPDPELSLSTLAGTPVSGSFTLKNPSGSVSVTGLLIDESNVLAPLSIAANDCGETLEPGGNCTVQIAFAASAIGKTEAKLSIAYDQGSTLTRTIIAEATSVPALGTLAFTAPNDDAGNLIDVSGLENDLGEIEFVVSRTIAANQSAQAISVPITVKGTGVNPAQGADYVVSTTTLSWGANDTADKSFTVSILNDEISEENETLSVKLETPTTKLGTRSGLKPGGKQPLLGAATSNEISITILDDDVQLLVSPDPELSLSTLAGTPVSGSFTLKNPSGSVAITGLAIDDSSLDSPLSIAANDCGVTLEPGGNCTVQIAFAPSAIGKTEAKLSIAYDQGSTLTRTIIAEATSVPALGTLAFTAPNDGAGNLIDVSGLENDLGEIEFVVSRTIAANQSAQAISVPITVKGTGVNPAQGADYVVSTTTLSWGANDTADKSFTVSIVDDGLAEENETLSVKLETPTTKLGTRSGLKPGGKQPLLGAATSNEISITILDDDVMLLVSPDPELSLSTLAGTPVSGSFTLKNPSGSVAITGLAIDDSSLDSPLSIAANDCGETLAPGTDCTVQIAFAASAIGKTEAKLSIAYDQGSTLTRTIIAEATSVPALGTLAFTAPNDGVGNLIDVSGLENDLGEIKFVVSRTIAANQSAQAISVPITVKGTGVNPAQGADYVVSTTTLSWGANDTADKSFTVSILNDEISEENETLSVKLETPTTKLGTRSGLKPGGKQPLLGAATSNEISITILDDDVQLLVSPDPELSLSTLAGTPVSGSFTLKNPSGSVAITGLAIDDSSLDSPLSIAANDCGETLAPGTDCTVQIAFAASAIGKTEAKLSIAYDQGSTLTRTIIAEATSVPALGTLAFTAPNDDAGNLIDVSGLENDLGEIEFVVSRTIAANQSAQAISVPITVKGTGVNPAQGADYVVSTTTLSWGANDTADKSFTVSIVDDGLAEENETLSVKLETPTTKSATRSGLKPGGKQPLLGAATSNEISITILDDDVQLLVSPDPELSLSTLAGTPVSGSFTLKNPSGSVSVTGLLIDESNVLAPLSIAANDCGVTLEPGTDCTVQIAFAPSAIGKTEAKLSIAYDQGSTLTRTIIAEATSVPALGTLAFTAPNDGAGNLIDVSGLENDLGEIEFVVSRTIAANQSAQAISVPITVKGTGVNPAQGADYVVSTTTLSWGVNDTADKSFTVSIVDDGLAEENETLSVKLETPTTKLGTRSGLKPGGKQPLLGAATSNEISITILDDDVMLLVSPDPELSLSTLAGTPVSGSFTLKNPSGSVAITGLAIDDSSLDSPLSIAANDCGVTLEPGGNCTVQIAFAASAIGKTEAELSIAYDQGSTLTRTIIAEATSVPALGTLAFTAPNDGAGNLIDVSGLENDLGEIEFVVSRTIAANQSAQAISVPITVKGTGVNPAQGADYVVSTTTLSWGANDTADKSFTVSILNDEISEENETLSVKLETPTTKLGTRSGLKPGGKQPLLGAATSNEISITILDDDVMLLVSPDPELSLSTLAGTPVSGSFTLKNPSGSVSVTGLLIDESNVLAPLSIAANDCGVTLEPGTDCTVQIAFAPSAIGKTEAKLSIAYDQGSTLTRTIIAEATSVPALGTLAFTAPNDGAGNLIDVSGLENDLGEIEFVVSRTIAANQSAQAISVPITVKGTGVNPAQGADYVVSTTTLSWGANDTADKSFTVSILNDEISEENETLSVKLETPTTKLGTRSGLKPGGKQPLLGAATSNEISITILDDDVQLLVSPDPELSLSTLAGTPVSGSFTLKNPSGSVSVTGLLIDESNVLAPLSIAANDCGVTLEPGTDCTVQIAFAPSAIGKTEAKLSIAYDQGSTLTRTIIAEATSVPALGTLAFTAPNDGAGNLIDVSGLENDLGEIEFVVSRTIAANQSAQAISVPITVKGTGVNPAQGADYVVSTTTLSWGANDTADKSFTVSILNDEISEENETLSVKLETPTTKLGTRSGLKPGGKQPLLGAATSNEISITILDDDVQLLVSPDPELSLSTLAGTPVSGSFTLKNPSGSVSVTGLLIDESNVLAPLSIAANDCGVTLEPGTDCTVQITFAPSAIGKTEAKLSIAYDQGSTLTRTIIAEATSVPALGTLAFTAPNDGAGNLIDVSGLENDLGEIEFVVSRTIAANQSAQAISVPITVKGTGVNPAQGADYVVSTTTLSWGANDTADKSFTVSIVDDGLAEENETLSVKLETPTTKLGTRSGLKPGGKQPLLGAATSNEISITILDDDVMLLVNPDPVLSLVTTPGAETGGSFTITNPPGGAVVTGLQIDTGNFAVPLTANAGDCATTLAPGASCRVEVTFEPALPFSQMVELIVRYDQGGDLLRQVDAVATAEPATLTVSPANSLQREVSVGETGTVTWTVTNIGETPTADLAVASTFSLAQGQSAERFTVDNQCPPVLGPQQNCAIVAAYSPDAGGSSTVAIEVTAAEQVLTRTLDVTVPESAAVRVDLLAAAASVTEGDSADGVLAGFSLQLSAPVAQAVTVTIATVNGSGANDAVAGSDYVGIFNRQIVLEALQTRADFSVEIIGDDIAEFSESFDVIISGVAVDGLAVNLGLAESTITIQDDDTLAAQLIATRLSFPNAISPGHPASVDFQVELENTAGTTSMPAFDASDIKMAAESLNGLVTVASSTLGQSCFGQAIGPIDSGAKLSCFITAEIIAVQNIEGTVTDSVSINYFDGVQQRVAPLQFTAVVAPLPPAGKITFASDQSGPIESDLDAIDLLVVRSAGSRGELKVSVEIDGSAVEGVDYELTGSRTLSWLDGDSSGRALRINWLSSTAPNERNLILRLVDATLNGQPSNESLGTPNTQTFTLQPLNPGQIRFAMRDWAFNEADAQQGIQVQRFGGDTGIVLVDYELLEGNTATDNGVDFAFASDSRTLRFDGSDVASIDLDLIGDAEFDPDETLSLRLLNPRVLSADGTQLPIADGLGAPSQADIIIRDQTQKSVISLASNGGVVTEGAAFGVDVTRSGGSQTFAGTASVRYLIGDAVQAGDCAVDAQNEAIYGEDYTSPLGRSGVVNWPAGNTDNQTITFNTIATDQVGETDERFSLVLCDASPSNAVELAGTLQAEITIVDPAQSGALAFEQDGYTVDESVATLEIRVTRDQPFSQAVSVEYSTVSGTALPGQQYVASSGTLEFPVGSREQTITIELIDDADRQDGTFSLVLENATPGVQISRDSTSVTIRDNTQADQLVLASATFTTSEQKAQVDIPVRRIGSGFGDVSLQFRVVPGSARPQINGAGDYTVIQPMTTTGGADSQQLIGTLTWPDDSAGQTRNISIAIARDGEFETVENFTVELVSSNGAQIGTPTSALVTIDDDPGASRIRFSENDYQFSEDVSADERESRGVTVLVSRTAEAESPGGEVEVRYQTRDLSAQAESDYSATSGVLTWAVDETGDKSFFVPIGSDDIIEGNEQFEVSLELLAGNNVLLDDPSTITIIDDSSVNTPVVLSYALLNADGEMTASGADPVLAVREGDASQVRLRITRSGGSQGLLTMDYVFGDAGDTASVADHDGVAGTLQWGQGETGDRFITFNVLDDNFFEGVVAETLTVRLDRAKVSWPGIVPAPSNTLIEQPDGNLTVRISDNESNILLGDDFEPTYWLEAVTEANLNQQAEPPVELESLQVRVLTSDRTAQVPNAQVGWSVMSDPRFPAQQVAELLAPDGSSLGTDAVTNSDANGIATVRVRMLRRGFSAVRATPVANIAAAKRQVQIAAPELAQANGDVIFRFTAGLQVVESLTPNQAQVARVIDFFCDAFIAGEVAEPPAPADGVLASPERQLFELCDLEDETEPEVAASLQALMPEEVLTLGDATIEMADLQVTNIYQRLNAIRSGQTGGDLDLSGLGLRLFGEQLPGGIIAAAVDEMSGGGAADDGLITDWGFFVNGAFSVGRARSTENEVGQKFDTLGVTAGVDLRLRGDLVIGGALGHTNHESDFVSNSGYSSLDGTYLTFFGTWYKINRGYVDGVLEIGRNAYDIRRRINLNLVDPEDGSLLQDTVPDQFADGDVSARSASLTLSAGMEYSGNGFEFGPYGRLSLSNATIEAYRERVVSPERVGEGYLLDIKEHDVRSTRLALGGQLSKTYNSTRGVFVPQFRIEAQYETQQRPDGITATFQFDPTGTAFTVNADDNESLVVNYGLGGSAVFSNGRSAYLYYEGQAGHDTITRHWLKGGFRVEF